ncbi:MAG: hypothetical protein RL562_1901 [Planctomycetota bacterium]|jgi:hypothetical protein
MTRRPMRTTVWAFGLLCAAGADLSAQEPVDPFDDAVTKAVTHGRYAVRRAAAGKIARAGDEAVPALRRYVEAHGKNSLPLELVDALAQADVRGPALEALLTAWATDQRFFWRSQALGGLARRGLPDARTLFEEALDDPSHLFRIEGARGLLAVAAADDEEARSRVRAGLQDDDPRVRLRVALMLLERGDGGGAAQIGAAVFGADRAFLDDRWGAREATFAVRELQRVAGVDVTAILGDDPDSAAAARQVLTAWVQGAEPGFAPAAPADPDGQPLFGIEIRSCRNGDLFVTAWPDGRMTLGLDPRREAQASAPARLIPPGDLDGVGTHGAVICDYVRVYVPSTPGQPPRAHHKAAPGAVPGPVLEWLKMLAASLDETGIEEPLSHRLEQFATSDG